MFYYMISFLNASSSLYYLHDDSQMNYQWV
ncbi:hypothetical protein [Vibrio phage vB_pir03]|nr:hypothetical protein [Vibrio phage vB_pir03]